MQMYRQGNRQTDGLTNGQTDEQIDNIIVLTTTLHSSSLQIKSLMTKGCLFSAKINGKF